MGGGGERERKLQRQRERKEREEEKKREWQERERERERLQWPHKADMLPKPEGRSDRRLWPTDVSSSSSQSISPATSTKFYTLTTKFCDLQLFPRKSFTDEHCQLACVGAKTTHCTVHLKAGYSNELQVYVPETVRCSVSWWGTRTHSVVPGMGTRPETLRNLDD